MRISQLSSHRVWRQGQRWNKMLTLFEPSYAVAQSIHAIPSTLLPPSSLLPDSSPQRQYSSFFSPRRAVSFSFVFQFTRFVCSWLNASTLGQTKDEHFPFSVSSFVWTGARARSNLLWNCFRMIQKLYLMEWIHFGVVTKQKSHQNGR